MSKSVSDNFREIPYELAFSNPLANAWMDPTIPTQQLKLVLKELALWADRFPMPLFDVLQNCLLHIGPTRPTELLEIGCGVGHNSVVVMASGQFNYTGIDYSRDFIQCARSNFTMAPMRTRFEVMDALKPAYSNSSFDVVVSSACLLHILDWRTALEQAARLSRTYLVLHRTPISRSNHPRYFIKSAYGVDVLEHWMTEYDLFEKITALGFELTKVWTTSADADCAYKTYLLTRSLMHHPV